MNSDRIRTLAKALDDTIEAGDAERLTSFFSQDCEVRLPGVTLHGSDGLRKAVGWMFANLKDISLVPVAITVQDNVFMEEFVLRARAAGGEVDVRQAEVLEYDADYRVKSLRLYFDRLELAPVLASGFIDRILIRQVSKASLKGLLP
jgi:ketosteroid isomerase-like protein